MVTYDECVESGLRKVKYDQLGGEVHDMSTDESEMYKAMLMAETHECKGNDHIGIISILSCNGLM